MSTSLKSIQQPIQTELKLFESHFRQSMQSSVPLLDKIMYYIVRRKGKQVRPMFVFLTAKLLGDIDEKTYRAASMIELLHTASLVHDDVVDDSLERRSFFSVNALWKNKIAVLVGDFLLSQGLLLSLRHKDYTLLHIVSEAVKAMSEGELLQIEKARRLDIEESVYFDIIRQKTASLIASACAAGAASITEDEDTIQKAHKMGELIGIAFQIRDDLFDFGSADVGKPLGIDIKEKKMTLPLIYALNNADNQDRKQVLRAIRKNSEDPEVIRMVVDFVKRSGGIDYTKKTMLEYRARAFDILNTFQDSESRQALEALVRFVTDREK